MESKPEDLGLPNGFQVGSTSLASVNNVSQIKNISDPTTEKISTEQMTPKLGGDNTNSDDLTNEELIVQELVDTLIEKTLATETLQNSITTDSVGSLHNSEEANPIDQDQKKSPKEPATLKESATSGVLESHNDDIISMEHTVSKEENPPVDEASTISNLNGETTKHCKSETNQVSKTAVPNKSGGSTGSSSGEKPKRKRRSSTIVSDVESDPSEGGRAKRARTKTQLFQSPAGIGTRANRSTSQSDFDETLSEKSKEESPAKTVEIDKHQILAVRSEDGFYLCRTAQGSRTKGDLKIEWLDSKDNKHYTLTKHFDKVTHASVLAELHLDKLKLPEGQRSRTFILDDDNRKIIEKLLKDSLKVGKEKPVTDQKDIKTNDPKEEPPLTRRRRSARSS